MGLVTQKLHITPNAFGVLDGRAPTGTVVPPTLEWLPVPSSLQNLEGPPLTVDLSVYLTSTSGDQITFGLIGGTWPTGWSISEAGLISYNGTGVGAAQITIRATQDNASADSNAFTVESIAIADVDALAPTIPTGLAQVSKSSSTIQVTCDAPSDVSDADAVPYTGMKEVRFFKDGVFDGVSSTSTGLSLRLSKADLSNGTGSARKIRAGHYTVLSDADTWSGTPYHGGTYTGIPNATHVWDTGPVTSDTAGIVLRRRWAALQSGATTYDFSSITSALAQLASLSLVQDPTGVKKIMLFVLIETRTFTGSDTWDQPMPAHLVAVADGGTGAKTYAEIFGPSGPQLKTGWQGWRWAPTVKNAYQALCIAIGNFPIPNTSYTIDSHPNFGGIGTQETATGAAAGGTGANEQYSPANFKQALKDESTYISVGCPTSRHLFYYNQIHGGNNADILEVAVSINANGAICGFPDLVMKATGVGSGLPAGYSICTNYHNGTGMTEAGFTMASIQQAEWAGIDPGDARSMQDLFDNARGIKADDFGNKRLKSDLMLWQWITGAQSGNGNQKFNSDATSIMHATPTFGTIVASAASSFVPGTLTQSGADYTIIANGAGVGSSSDEWTAGRATITGDGSIVFKCNGVTGANIASAFMGLSFRETDTAGSRAVHLILSDAGLASKYRSIADSTVTTISSTASLNLASKPYVKGLRVGNLFSLYYGSGLGWTAIGSINLALNSTIFVEPFAGSGVSTPITASFSQVCIQNLSDPTYTFSGLTASHAYSLTAIARDVQGNDSAASAALSITTSSAVTPAYTLRAVGAEAHGTSATPGAPAGVTAGDLLLLRCDCRNNADTFTTPTGWAKISLNSAVTWNALYARIATGTAADNPPTMASSGANQIICQIACFSGSVYTDLATIVHASNDKKATNNDILYDALTVSGSNCLIIAWGNHNKTSTSNGATVNSLTGFTQLGQQNPNGSTVSTWWGYVQQTTAANLSAVTQTRTGTAESLQYTSLYIALKTG